MVLRTSATRLHLWNDHKFHRGKKRAATRLNNHLRITPIASKIDINLFPARSDALISATPDAACDQHLVT
jgi:hypothetical protein